MALSNHLILFPVPVELSHVIVSHCLSIHTHLSVAALGSSDYDAIEFDNVVISEAGPFWNPDPALPAQCQPDANGSYVGHPLSVRPCNRNGIAASDQQFLLLGGDFGIQHVPSGLCVMADAATEGSGLSLQPCQFNHPLQKFNYNFGIIHHGPAQMFNEAANNTITGFKNGRVGLYPAGYENIDPTAWTLWTSLLSTGQLKHSLTEDFSLGYQSCLSLCPEHSMNSSS